MTIFCAPTTQTSAAAPAGDLRSPCVNENSMTSGSAVFCSAVSTSVRAMIPGSSFVAVGGLAAPISGSTRPNTNRKKIGCSSAWAQEGDRLVADRDPQVALAQRRKNARSWTRACLVHRISRPVRWTNTSSSVPSIRRSSTSDAPSPRLTASACVGQRRRLRRTGAPASGPRSTSSVSTGPTPPSPANASRRVGRRRRRTSSSLPRRAAAAAARAACRGR